MGKTRLYHPTEAPEGQTFDITTEPSEASEEKIWVASKDFPGSSPVLLESLEKEGWVDNPAKVGITWGSVAEEGVREKKKQYQNGEIPGMDKIDKGIRCTIWGTVASDETAGGRDGKLMDAPRAGG